MALPVYCVHVSLWETLPSSTICFFYIQIEVTYKEKESRRGVFSSVSESKEMNARETEYLHYPVLKRYLSAKQNGNQQQEFKKITFPCSSQALGVRSVLATDVDTPGTHGSDQGIQ